MILIFSTSEALQQSWDYYYRQGEIQYHANMFDYSLESMIKALEANPGSFEAANYIGRIYLLKNRRDAALQYFERSLEINPNQSGILNEAGLLHDFYINRDKAFASFMKAAESDDSNAQAHLNLVRHYYHKKNIELAKYHLEKARAIGAQKSKSAITEAASLEKKKKYDQAVKLYENAMVEDPARIETYFSIYEIYRKTGRYKKAADVLERVIYLVPFNEQAYVHLANLYYNNILPGNRKYYLNMAIKYLNKALKLNPSNYELYFTMSDIYKMLGDDSMSKEMLEKGIEAEKNNH